MFKSYDQVISFLENQDYQDTKRQALDIIKLYGDPNDDALSELCAEIEDDAYGVESLERIIKSIGCK